MDLLKETLKKMVKKFYQEKDEKKEKKYQYKRYFFKKKMKLKEKIKTKYKIKYKWIDILYNFNKLKYPRIKIIIFKKHIKLSTYRNKIKRIIYEIFRINQHKIKNIDLIFKINKKINYIKKKYIIKNIKKIIKINSKT